MTSTIEKLCKKKGIKLTKNKKLIIDTILRSKNHPDVQEIYDQVSKINTDIGIATVYRIVRTLSDNNIIKGHDFGGEKLRYEENLPKNHHDHLINIQNGEVVEFFNQEIEHLKEKIAKDLGYKLVDHKLELYAIPIK